MSDLLRGLRPVRIEMEERCDEHGGIIAPGTTVNKEDLIAFITAVMKEKAMQTPTPTTEREDAINTAKGILLGEMPNPDIYLLSRQFLAAVETSERQLAVARTQGMRLALVGLMSGPGAEVERDKSAAAKLRAEIDRMEA